MIGADLTDPHHAKDDPEFSEQGNVHGYHSYDGPSHPPLGVTVRATVDRVVDGDTIYASVTWPMAIRLMDCWAPEVRGEEHEAGLKSKEHMEKLAPVGAEIIVQIPSRHAHSLGDLLTFGRVVGQVWRTGDSESLSEIMVGAGFATKEKVRD